MLNASHVSPQLSPFASSSIGGGHPETPRTNDSSSASRSLTPPSLTYASTHSHTPYTLTHTHAAPPPIRATVTPLRHAAPRWLPINPPPSVRNHANGHPVVWPAARPLTPPPASAAWTPRTGPPPPHSPQQTDGGSVWPNMVPTRAVTPPPIIQPAPLSPQQQPADQGGWITVSTANMSPFMILRIKALIELAAIQGYQDTEKISANAAPSVVVTKSCLRKKVARALYEEDLKRAAENYDAKCVAELNNLLEQSRQKAVTNPRLRLQEANITFDQLKRQVAQHSNGPDTKLAFSPGATLICFDSGEKPRKIRENHARHFNYFLMMQRQALGIHTPSPSTASPSVVSPPPPRSVTPLATATSPSSEDSPAPQAY